jgi:hypothetical protein
MQTAPFKQLGKLTNTTQRIRVWDVAVHFMHITLVASRRLRISTRRFGAARNTKAKVLLRGITGLTLLTVASAASQGLRGGPPLSPLVAQPPLRPATLQHHKSFRRGKFAIRMESKDFQWTLQPVVLLVVRSALQDWRSAVLPTQQGLYHSNLEEIGPLAAQPRRVFLYSRIHTLHVTQIQYGQGDTHLGYQHSRQSQQRKGRV